MVYLQDAVRMVLETRDERPLHTISKYFQSVLQGSHVLLREFTFVNATPRNRLAFVRILVDTFKGFAIDAEMTVSEHRQLVCLLCPDFPTTVHHAMQPYMPNWPDEAAVYKYPVLSAFFQVMFVFAEFVEHVSKLFAGEGGGVGGGSGGTLTRTSVLWSVRSLINTRHAHFSCPAASLLEAIVAEGQQRGGRGGGQDVSFDEFVVGMAACEAIIMTPVAQPADA